MPALSTHFGALSVTTWVTFLAVLFNITLVMQLYAAHPSPPSYGSNRYIPWEFDTYLTQFPLINASFICALTGAGFAFFALIAFAVRALERAYGTQKDEASGHLVWQIFAYGTYGISKSMVIVAMAIFWVALFTLPEGTPGNYSLLNYRSMSVQAWNIALSGSHVFGILVESLFFGSQLWALFPTKRDETKSQGSPLKSYPGRSDGYIPVPVLNA